MYIPWLTANQKRVLVILWGIVGGISYSLLFPVRDGTAFADYQLARPGVNVILGGDQIGVGGEGGIYGMGAVCFYCEDGKAVCLAHETKAHGNSVYMNGAISSCSVVANTLGGVVVSEVVAPVGRQVLALGGTDDVSVGGRATVYPPDAKPYSVTVRGFKTHDGSQYLILAPDHLAGRGRPGRSGSPVVQNGVIVAFVRECVTYGSRIDAIAAADVYRHVRDYLQAFSSGLTTSSYATP